MSLSALLVAGAALRIVPLRLFSLKFFIGLAILLFFFSLLFFYRPSLFPFLSVSRFRTRFD